MSQLRRRGIWAGHAAAFFAFLAAALWSSRAVLPDPETAVTLGARADVLWESDLKRNLTQLAYVSRTLMTDPVHLFDGQMCYPAAASVTFGEHMLGEGILGLPAHFLWDDPVATFNFVVTARPLIGAVSMYALAYYWTGSFAAALIAGLLFGFHPTRLTDLLHPSVVGNEWIPAILLSMHLLFTRRRWRDAVILSILASLQMLESMYVLLQFALVAGIYGVYLLWRYRRAVPLLLPKLGVVAGSLAAVGIWVFGPYLETREVWGILQGRGAFPTTPDSLWIGHRFYPGSCLLVLAALGLLDRLRGARTKHGYDPRVLLLLIALVATWFVIPWQVPWTRDRIPSLRWIFLLWLPGLDAVRAPANVFFATAIPLGLLAAYGVCALGEKVGPKTRAIIGAVIVAAWIAEIFLPAMAERSFGRSMPSMAFRIRPPEADLAVVRDLPPGPVLDLPLDYRGLGSIFMGRQVLLGAYHEHRQAACKASFLSPVQSETAAIARRLPRPAAARELWALGFRTILFHGQEHPLRRRSADRIIRGLSKGITRPHLVPLGDGRTVRAFRIEAEGPVTTDVASLSPVSGSQAGPSGSGIELRFRTRSGGSTFRHPNPVQPTEVLVTWKRNGTTVQSKVLRVLLPLALAPGRVAETVVEDTVPQAPGMYQVTLALADDPQKVLGIQLVRAER